MNHKNLEDLRKEIDVIDKKIINLIAERCSVSVEVGKIKKKKEIAIQNKRRERELLDALGAYAEEKDLSPTLIKKIFIELLKESRRIQRK